jgi:hypothetical protein
MIYRSAGLGVFGPVDRVDPRVPAVRIFTDDEMREGERLVMDVFLDDGPVQLHVQVDDVTKLNGQLARFDVELRVTEVDPERVPQLLRVLR